MENTSRKKQKSRRKDGAWMCLRSVEAVGHAVELGEGILAKDLLDNPPDGRPVGDVVTMHALWHS